MTPTLRVLLTGLVDYAGLFPPAALEMREVVERYAAYCAGPRAWMVGRLIVPASRLDDLELSLAGVGQAAAPREPRPVSVVAAPPFDDTIGRIWDFNGRHGACGDRSAVVDAVEIKASTAEEVERAADAFPAGFDLFVEPPVVNLPAGLLQSAAACGAMIKLRTGGTSADQVPSPLALATAIDACHRAGVAFKATAGLHHPLRSERPLTYEPAPPRAVLHGFLNVLLAAAVIKADWCNPAGAAELLGEHTPDAFRWADQSVAWRSHQLTVGDLHAARRFFRSFGSCSFEEPVTGLESLALL